MISSLLSNPFIQLAWVLTAIVFWRTIAGHFAWEMHRTAARNSSIKPPVENWVMAAILALPLAIMWPLMIPFLVRRWPLSRGTEKQAEILLKDLKVQHLELTNATNAKQLGIGGEVVDDEPLAPANPRDTYKAWKDNEWQPY